MQFEEMNLDARLLSAVKAMGYTAPTPIQSEAIPHVMAGSDVLGLAQTGTGKTAAFLLPILQRLLKGKLGVTRALIVAPTRELAEQIQVAATQLAKNTRIRTVAIYGGVSKRMQVQQLRRGAEIIVACPGRLLDHVGDGAISLKDVEVLVLDEADHMFDMGFLPDVRRILALVPYRQQTLLFSATMPYEIRSLADSVLKEPIKVQTEVDAPAKTVSHALYPVPEGLKTRLLMSMLDQHETGKVLVFTRTKRRARDLADNLERAGHSVTALQGNMAQNQRQAAINGFRNGQYRILVATDIAARGIDVKGISHVINYDMPDTVEAYTHRIGRTGRAYTEGEAYTYVHPLETPSVHAIEKVLGSEIERRRLEGFDYGAFTPEKAVPARRTVTGGGYGSGRPGGRNRRPSYGNRSAAPASASSNAGAPAHSGSNKSNGNNSSSNGSTSAKGGWSNGGGWKYPSRPQRSTNSQRSS